MRRKLNVKLALGVLVGLLVAGVGVHFLHGYQVQRNSHRLLERGDRAVGEKDDEKAFAYYAQYLAFAPNDVDTVQKYAVVLDRHVESDGERVRLVLLMEQVLRAKPNQHDLRLRLVDNLIALGRYAEAIDNLKRSQGASKGKGDQAELLHRIGWCQDAKKDYAQAAQSFEKAIEINPQQIKSYALLAEVLQERLTQPDDAQKVMDDLVRANADNCQAYLLRGQFLRKRGDEQAAQGDLQRAYELAPDRPEVILEIADAARARGDWKEAVRFLQDGMKRFPNQVDFYRAISTVKLLTERRDEAIDHVKAGLRQAPKSLELTVLLIELLIDQKQYKEAREKIDGLAKSGLKPALPIYLKARLAVADQQWRDAIRLLESARQDLAGSEWHSRINLLLGLSYRQIGDHERELQAFRRAVAAEPTWITASVELGAALLNNGRIEEAAQALEPLKTAKDVPAGFWLLLSRTRLHRQRRLPTADRRWDEVEEAFAEAVKAEPKSFETATLRADLLAARGKSEQAIAEYTRALELGETQPRVLASLVELLLPRREFAKAETELTKYERKRPLTGEVARLGAEVALGLHDAKLAAKRAAQAVTLPPRDYRDALWLARIYAAAGEKAKTESLLHASLDDAGHVPDVWIAWMEHLQQTKQHDRALKDFDRLKKELPANLQPLTIARCYEVLQLPVEAAKAYQNALRQKPDDYVVLMHAADFYRGAGEVEEARKLYERLLDPALAVPDEYVVQARRHLAAIPIPKKGE